MTEPTPPNTEKPKKSTISYIGDKLSSLKDKLSNVSGATRKAWEKSFGSADFKISKIRTWPKAAFLFFKNFIKELGAVEKEEEETTAETEEELAEVVGEPVEDALSNEKLGFGEDVDDEKELPGEEELVEIFEEEFITSAALKDDDAKEKAKTLAAAAAKGHKVAEKDNEKAKIKGEIEKMAFGGVYTLYYLRKKFKKREDLQKFFEALDKIKSSKVNTWKKWIKAKFKILFTEDVVLNELFPKTFGRRRRMKNKRLIATVDKLKGKTSGRLPEPEYLAKLAFLWDRSELKKLAKILYSPKAIARIHDHFKEEKEEESKSPTPAKDEKSEEKPEKEIDEQGNVTDPDATENEKPTS